MQTTFDFPFASECRSHSDILRNVHQLIAMHRSGKLGGALMPEDQNPHYPPDSAANYHYFTLPMALNYQRNSYKLWEAAQMTAVDRDTKCIFSPSEVCSMSRESVRAALIKYKVALQPNKHTDTWIAICCAINDILDGDIRNLFTRCDYNILDVKTFVQITNKKRFPYLSGEKICNYWLYVVDSYTVPHLNGKQHLTVAPDTHVLQASVRLGVVTDDEASALNARVTVSARWAKILEGTGLDPIDIHTPLWLWSRGGFQPLA